MPLNEWEMERVIEGTLDKIFKFLTTHEMRVRKEYTGTWFSITKKKDIEEPKDNTNKSN